MLQIKERDQCIIHEEGILHNIRPRHSKPRCTRWCGGGGRAWQHCGRDGQILVPTVSHKTCYFLGYQFHSDEAFF